ncbi:MAG: hypothetical protein ACKV0T_07410 [Planctomycetales bacterium]
MNSQSNVANRDGNELHEGERPSDEMKIADDLVAYFRRYAKERPQTLALACLGLGFVLGWKLKPW